MADDLDDHVRMILGSRRIRDRIVVLCEGDRIPILEGHALSPQWYRRLEKTPDANFYKACVPVDWHGSRLPHFFNCGGRSDVLRAFTALLAAHRADPEQSYLTPEKLYALVDVDLHAEAMPRDYPWATTETVHEALYHDGIVRSDLDANHRIWVTAFVHKEAFFVLPGATASWVHEDSPHFANGPLELSAFYRETAHGLKTDGDVERNLFRVTERLQRFVAGPRMNCACTTDLADSWLAEFNRAGDDEQLVRALLAVAKVKRLWQQVGPDPRFGDSMPAEGFRDQLVLNIGRVISTLPADAHPLAGFFAWLKDRR